MISRFFKLAALTLLFNFTVKAESVADYIGKGLPVVEIITENEQEPTCDIVYPPEGLSGISITNAIKVPGRIKVYGNDGNATYDSGDYVKSESGLTIKVRGNTSAVENPKPYKIKLQKKADLLGRGDKKYNDKNWVLLKDYSMKNYMGRFVNDAFKLDWTPQGEYVSVVLNGTFRGLYLLSEGVERNTDCRIDVDKSGFVAEFDPYWWNEDGEYLNSLSWGQWVNYTLKYPEFEDATPEQLAAIQTALNRYEQSIIDGTYDEVIDVDSYARALLAQDCLGIMDWIGSNIYFSKYDDSEETKMRRPVLWDFDTAECTPDAWSGPHTEYFNQFLDSPNTAFKRTYIDIWKNEGSKALDEVMDKIKEFSATDKMAALDYAADLTMKLYKDLWIGKAQDSLDRAIVWYKFRKQWMEDAVAQMEEELKDSAVDEIFETAAAVIIEGNTIRSSDGEPFTVYTLQGIPASPSGVTEATLPVGGIYIVATSGRTLKIQIRE